MYKLVFEIDPVPASRPRVSQYRTYYLSTYSDFRERMERELTYVKRLLLEKPLIIDITFWKKIPKSFSIKDTNAMHNTYCVSNIDLDNLEKAIYDSLNGHVFVDDKQIVEHTTRKKWTKETAKIELIIKEINV